MPSFTHSLNIIGRCTQMERSDKLKRLGVCGGQVPYLLRLCRRPGLSQEEMAEQMRLCIAHKPACHAALSAQSRSQAGRGMYQIGG